MTTIVSVAVLIRLPVSMARTVKLLVPTSGDKGVPDNRPALLTPSQPGPPVLAKVKKSSFGSDALSAMVPV